MQTHTPTLLIQKYSDGDSTALNELFELVYDELHSIAKKQRGRWNGAETINTVALIHETYLKLWKNQPNQIENKRHFLALASKAMRQILINYAERTASVKRGGEYQRAEDYDLDLIGDQKTAAELLEMDEVLKQFEKVNERQSKVFECRFFGGMTVEDTAFALDISPATVKRDWQAACNWIYEKLGN